MAQRIVTKAFADKILTIVWEANKKASARTQEPSLGKSGKRNRKDFIRLQEKCARNESS
jgi:hypothetical protein